MNNSQRSIDSASQILEQFLTPRKKSPSTKEQKLIERAEIFSIPTRKTELTAYSWGEGATVLLVHGWAGRGTIFGWSFIEPLVESGYRVLSFDAPAHGRSPGQQTNGFELSEAIATVAKHESPIDSVIAHSMGVTNTVLALSKEVFARKIVCLASMCWLSSSVKRFAKILRLSQHQENELFRSMENKFGKDVWEAFSADKKVSDLNIKALLFHDRNDKDFLLQESEAISHFWQGSRLIITEGLGHKRILRDKQVIQKTVEFITGKI